MTTNVDLILDQGADFSTSFTLAYANGAVLDLSTYTGACQMRRSYSSNTFIAFNVSTFANGDVMISLPYANTALIDPGRYYYNIDITSSSNVVSRVIEGIIDVDPNMTR